MSTPPQPVLARAAGHVQSTWHGQPQHFPASGNPATFWLGWIEDGAYWNAIADARIREYPRKHRTDILPANLDGSPKSPELKEVFHLERPAG